MFVIAARILVNEGLEATQDFIAQVNAHIEALSAWESEREIAHRNLVLRWSYEPTRETCDSEASFQSAHRCWREAQSTQHNPRPAPTAPIRVERAIVVEIAEDGSRSYKYAEDELSLTVYRDRIIRMSRESA